MKNVTKILLLLAGFTALLSSCKKDDNKTKADFLQDRSCWKSTKVELKDEQSGLYVDATPVFLGNNPCNLDDCTTFAQGGVYTVTEGASKCDPSYPDLIDNGTWSLSTDESSLTIITNGESATAKVESLTSDKLVISGMQDGFDLRITYQ